MFFELSESLQPDVVEREYSVLFGRLATETSRFDNYMELPSDRIKKVVIWLICRSNLSSPKNRDQ